MESYYYFWEPLKTKAAPTIKAGVPPDDHKISMVDKCLESISDFCISLAHIGVLFLLGFILLLVDFVTVAGNYLINKVPVSLIQNQRGVDELLAGENRLAEITLGLISGWLLVV